MRTRNFESIARSTTARLGRRAVCTSVWLGLLGALAAPACGSGETSGDGPSEIPDGGEAGVAGAAGSGGDSSMGGSATGGNSTGGTAPIEECEAGEFNDDDDAALACAKWSDCAAGEYVNEAGTATSDRECAACGAGTFSNAKNASACEAWTPCVPGQFVSTAGSETADQQCGGCESGTFSTLADETECADWKTCEAGTYVSNTPSATVDRVCVPCAEGEYTAGPNQSVCQPVGACPAGTVQTAPGTGTSAPDCDACDAGNYCAGGTTPAQACAAGTWDHDASSATVCAAKTDCVPGERVSAEGGTTSDRSCTDCAVGSFTTEPNAETCSPWTVCGAGFVEETPGTATSDRTCQQGGWTRQFGTGQQDGTNSVTLDGSGNVYVAGLMMKTTGANGDAFVRKYDATGSLLWATQFGSSAHDAAGGVSVDGSGNIYVTGNTDGALPSQVSAGNKDAFLKKYDAAGAEQWTRQFGTSGADYAWAVKADGAGNVYVAAYGGTGTEDVFLRKYDSAGSLQWTRQIATSTTDRAWSVTTDGSGNVYVAGDTAGSLPSQTSAGGYDAFVRKYDGAGTEVWTQQFGTNGGDYAASVAVDGSGNVYVAGLTGGTFSGQTGTGTNDVLVRKYDSAGGELWTRQFGGAGHEQANSVAVDGSGGVYVVGDTDYVLSGQTSAGGKDVFVKKYNGAGGELWTNQLGSAGNDSAAAAAVTTSGVVYLGGTTYNAAWPSQTLQGLDDAFVLRLVP